MKLVVAELRASLAFILTRCYIREEPCEIVETCEFLCNGSVNWIHNTVCEYGNAYLYLGLKQIHSKELNPQERLRGVKWMHSSLHHCKPASSPHNIDL